MTPLILLVGFLGSGKTTYLRTLLPLLGERGVEPHVIINDYQNARVDAEMIRGLADSVVPISGSCVCCGSRDELLGALEGFEHQDGRVVVIETNGTTDAEELVELLSLEPGLAGFTLPVQISLVDAKRWQKRFWHNGLERDQVKTAAYLHISYTDLVAAERLAKVRAGLVELGVRAADCAPGEAAEMISGLVREVAAIDRSHESHRSHAHESHGSHGSHGPHHEHFASMQIELPEPVDRVQLEAFLRALPDGVMRVKGVVRLADTPGDVHVFQKVEQSDAVQFFPIGKENRLGGSLAVLIGAKISTEAVACEARRFFSPVVGAS